MTVISDLTDEGICTNLKVRYRHDQIYVSFTRFLNFLFLITIVYSFI
jgi:myosin heavy subunit